MSSYRPDIDGLRAVAVVSVLLFHAKLEFFSGGYIGVDVFFVISGYLITSIIVKQISDGEFSVLGFYERRFRRLLPALFVVVLITVLLGIILLHPRDLVDLGKSSVATFLFSSNILFSFQSGYFDGPAEFKPLLHTWSLAVEEQYYVLFPIFLVLVNKYSSTDLRIWFSILLVLSFVLCIVGTALNPTDTFFLLPGRAWELLAGSLIAVHAFPAVYNRFLRELLASLGMFFILFSLVFYTADTSFPGYAAALPVIGAMLLLYSGENQREKTLVARILSAKQIVFIGLISYSLYLWHWPILVYSNYITVSELNSLQLLFALGATFILALLSWRYIELPFRKKSLFASMWQLLSASGFASLGMVIFGFILIAADGLPNRYSYASSGYKSDANEWSRWGECQDDMTNRLFDSGELCNIGNRVGAPKFLLWGDSHARALAPAVEASAVAQDLYGVITTKTACPPLLGIDRVGETSCAAFNDEILQFIASNSELKTIVLSGRWNLVFTGKSYKEEPVSIVNLYDIHSDGIEHDNAWYVEHGLRRTIETLTELGKSVVVVNEIPEIGYDVPRIDFISRLLFDSLDERISPTTSEFRVRSDGIHRILDRLSEEYDINVLDPSSYLCSNEICRVSTDGTTLYLDDDHLSISGSRSISNMFDATFGSLR